VRDEELVHQLDVPSVVTLQDGSQVDGVLARYDGYYGIANAKFVAWQVDDAFLDTAPISRVWRWSDRARDRLSESVCRVVFVVALVVGICDDGECHFRGRP
jgi:hypothetical protein